MSPWLVPISVEVCIFLLFCGVLYYLRRSLTLRSAIFWTLLWIARAAASLGGLRFFAASESLVLIVYTPLQVAFALALVIIAFRLEHQKDELRRLREELERLRREAAGQLDTDTLTGLFSHSALKRWMEEARDFEGFVVVCDLDDFKALNDHYGHLVGDEILHGMGRLLTGSIREEDRAFRWGGDEFVVCFRNLDLEVVEARMREIEGRLESFQIRHHGPMAVRFSWGTAPARGAGLRDALAEADRRMYEQKRSRRANKQSAGQ